MRCKTLEDVVGEVLRLVEGEKSAHPECHLRVQCVHTEATFLKTVEA